MRSPVTFVLAGAVIFSALTASALTSSALADKGPGLFDRTDKDSDGFVSKLEFNDGRDTLFASIDADGDRLLTQDELQKAHETWRQKMDKPAQEQTQPQEQSQNQSDAQQPPKERHGFMKRVDANEDGQISIEEFAAAGDKMFARLDHNGDGKIAKEEVPQRRKHKASDQPADQPTEQP